MFSTFTEWVDQLLKAAGHKYIKRIPYASGGKTRYRYIYKVTHTAGGKHVLDPDHMVVGAAFQLEPGAGKEVHAHITKVDGDMVTYRLDDGPQKGETVTESKAALAKKLNEKHGVHGAISAERDKQAKVVADLKAGGASTKQVAREQARLDRLEAALPAPAPEPKSEEPKKRAAKKPAGAFAFEVEGMNARGLKAMMEDASTRGTPANKELAAKLMESVDIKGDQVMISESPAERNATLQSIYSLVMGHSVGKDSEVLSRFGAAKNKRAIEALARKLNEKPKSEEPKSEEPKSEEPKGEEPKSEEPKSEEPKSDERPAYAAAYIDQQHAPIKDALQARDKDALAATLSRIYAGPFSGASSIGASVGASASEDAAELLRVAALRRTDLPDLIHHALKQAKRGVLQIAENTLYALTHGSGEAMYGLTRAEKIGGGRATPEQVQSEMRYAASINALMDGDYGLDGTPAAKARGRVSDADIARQSRDILDQVSDDVKGALSKQLEQHKHALQFLQGDNARLEQYAQYAKDAAGTSAAPRVDRFLDSADARGKGTPGLVSALQGAISHIEGRLADSDQLKRDVFDKIKWDTNRSRPRQAYINNNIDRMLSAMQATL